MRNAAILVLGSLLALAAGCDRARNFADNVARERFEERCGSLPPGGVDVVRIRHPFDVDRSRSQGDLEQLGESTSPRHRTVGLTRASFGYRSTIDLDGLEDARGGRACARPRVRVEVELSGMTVYVAREYAHDACAETLILTHERAHVAVFDRYADEAVRTLAAELGAHFGGRTRHGATMPALQAALQAELREWLDAFMARARDELAARNAAVDAPDEYALLARRCGPVA